MAPDGARQRRLTNRPGNDHWPPAWSPDSKRLLVTADGMDMNHPQGYGEIVPLDLSTGESERLTTNPSDDLIPAWRGTQ
jgi:Tol biopolymer transport system component